MKIINKYAVRKNKVLASIFKKSQLLLAFFLIGFASLANAELVIQENEAAFCSVDGSIDANHSGFTGSGFANTDNAVGSAITWSLLVSTSDYYVLQWRFANGSSDNRSASISVNQANSANIDFNGTGAWSTWVESSSLTVYLTAGYNEISAIALNSGGLPNIDELTIFGEGLSGGDCSGAGPTPTLEPTPTPSPTPTLEPSLEPTLEPTPTDEPGEGIVIQEQESGFCDVEGSIDNNNSGFTGSGFANTDNASGNGIDWAVSVEESGNYDLQWNFANGSSSNRTAAILINGNEQASVDFNGTGSWSNWDDSAVITVYLNSGQNLIRAQANTSGGLANVDYIRIFGLGISPGNCDVTGPTPEPSLEPTPTEAPTPTPPLPTDEPTPLPTLEPGPVKFDTNVPMGWAVVPGYGIRTTTGGAGGEVVTATSHSQLASYVSGDVPRIVRVQGSISGGNINVGSNKTIIGMGSNTRLSGFYLNLNPSRNVIIRNLEISGGTDAIAARQTNHLWIDHVYVHNCGDGLIDLTRETDMYTVSWTEFANHHKTMLLNGGSTHFDDRGKLNGTIHHNFFNGTNTRNPRAGFGKIHIFNDYNLNNSYGIGFHTECLVLAERNYFEDTGDAIRQMYSNSAEQGDALAIDNIFDNSSGDDSTGIGFDPTAYYLYDFVLDEASAVPDVVRAGAGPAAEFSEIGLMPIPGQGAVGVSDPVLSWKTGTYDVDSYVLYFGTTSNPPRVTATTSTSYNVGSLSSGQLYYWRVDQVGPSGTAPGLLWVFKAN